jgi:serine/threonine protein kinase
VQERIGSGSHGVVFRVLRADKHDGKSYALKLAQQKNDPRMEREVRLLSQIRHPSVPRLEGSGSWTSPRGDTYPYLVMEWVEGTPLYKWAMEQGITLRQIIRLLAQVARALEATHRYGVHRDVKGGNVYVNEQGRAVLLDFGSCWYQGASPLTDGALPPGTEKYRSPQLLFFRYALRCGAEGYYEAPPEDDVYALGVTAYRLLAGDYPPRPPDSEESKEEAAKPVRVEPPKGLADKCPELSALIVRMLSEDPPARGNAGRVARELESLSKDSCSGLDEPWVLSQLQPPTEDTWRPPPPRSCVLREWWPGLAPIGLIIGLVLLTVLVWPSSGRRSWNYVAEPSNGTPGKEKPDGGTGMGEEAMTSVESLEGPPISAGAVSRDVPERPSKEVARPPCARFGAVEINGGCWWRPEGAGPPPCKFPLYEHEGRCYAPVTLPQRQPTSDDP